MRAGFSVREWTEFVIRIRYPDFSSGISDLGGLHGIAEPGARGATVYLLPGLTGGQRKAVIRRLRQEASRGFGPALPLPSLLIALGVDRLRMAAGTAAAIFRLHPAVTLLPGAVVAAMAFFILASTGAGPGPAPRTGLAGVLVDNGEPAGHEYPASADGSAVAGPTGIGPGGSGLGSAVTEPGWLARLPAHGRRKAACCGRGPYTDRGGCYRPPGARRYGGRPYNSHLHGSKLACHRVES
jgi:hypothetical protein